jgi:acyl dehydratase
MDHTLHWRPPSLRPADTSVNGANPAVPYNGRDIAWSIQEGWERERHIQRNITSNAPEVRNALGRDVDQGSLRGSSFASIVTTTRNTMTSRIDPRQLLSRHFAPIEHTYDARDTQLYALGVGLGNDPLDASQLRYVYEGGDGDSLLAMPTMANVLAYPGFWAREPDTGIDWRRVLHAEQEIVLHEVLPARGTLLGVNRVTALWDRGPEKGAFMQQRREVRDPKSGKLLVTVTQLNLLRGDGGFGAGGSEGAPPSPHAIPSRAPDVVCDLATLPQAALIYRLNGDLNPLHADPAVARAAGFERPILHGMATMGFAAHAVLRELLEYDSSRFIAMRVRFTAPALPGDTLRTEMWVDGKVVSLRTIAVERGTVVLNNARVDLR